MVWKLTNEEVEQMKKIGYSDFAIKLFNEKVNFGILEEPDVSLTTTNQNGHIVTLYLKVEDGHIIKDAKFQYVGCAALAIFCAVATELAKNKSISEAKKISVKDLTEKVGNLPKNHLHYPEFVVATLKETIEIFERRKMLTIKEHDEYVHFCGLTGKELENFSSFCSVCSKVQECENDHVIVEHH